MDRQKYKAEWYQLNKERISLERKAKYIKRIPRSEDSLRETRKQSWIKHNQTPIAKYRFQKNSAHRRNIPWEFTFELWWEVWEKSGKWEQRGQRADQYCMCRYNDVGPYSPSNVYISTTSENAKEVRMLNKLRKA
jgi:hypothetical protein